MTHYQSVFVFPIYRAIAGSIAQVSPSLLRSMMLFEKYIHSAHILPEPQVMFLSVCFFHSYYVVFSCAQPLYFS